MTLRNIYRYMPATESVGISELEKYLDREKTAKSKGEAAVDVLNVQIEKEYEMQQPDDPAAASSTTDTTETEKTPTDEPAQDTADDTPEKSSEEDDASKEEKAPPEKDKGEDKEEKDQKEEPEEDKEEIPEETDEKPAKECMRDLWLNKISLEDYGPSSSNEKTKYIAGQVWNGVKYVAGHAIDLGLKAGAILVELGIRHGPTVINKLYHGVLFVFTKLAKLVLVSSDRISRFRYRSKNSYEDLNEKIANAKRVLELHPEDREGDSEGTYYFTNQKTINDLKVGSDTDVLKNVRAFTSFIKNAVIELDKCISEEIAKTKHMAHLTSETSAVTTSSSFYVKVPDKFIVKGQIDGYGIEADYLESYVSKETLCGDIRIIAHLPKREIATLDVARKSYNHSKMFLGMDAISFKEVQEIPYLDREQTAALLEEISILCGICLQHQQMYEKLSREKDTFKLLLRNYFNSLVESDEKVSLKNTSLELMYLKTMFVDKVYVPMAMDIHELCIKVINSSLTLCNESMKGWK